MVQIVSDGLATTKRKILLEVIYTGESVNVCISENFLLYFIHVKLRFSVLISINYMVCIPPPPLNFRTYCITPKERRKGGGGGGERERERERERLTR